MKNILSISIAIIIVFTFAGCSQKNNTQTVYNVIKTIEAEGQKYNFDYNSEKNCVTVSVNDSSDSSILFFVNDDGAITSMYGLESGRQTTLFEENSEGYPITNYNDSGSVKSVEYDDLMVTFTYNNYVENRLTDITYCEWDSYYGWDKDNAHTYNVSDYESAGIVVNYIETTNPNFKMFNSMMWFFSMADALDAVYN